MAIQLSNSFSLTLLQYFPTFRLKHVIVSFATLFMLILLLYTPLPSECDAYNDGVVCHLADGAKHMFPQKDKWRPTELNKVKSTFAFATFLASSADSDENDPYFVAARILTYQFLHAEETRSRNQSIPFIVLVTDKVSEAKRERLRKDGAIVVLGEAIKADWVKADVSTWDDVMTKLRLWELTQFERICMLDGDTVLAAPLDCVFDDPAVTQQQTLSKPEGVKADEGAIPSSYSFAGVPEMNREHGFPPANEHHDFPNKNYLNSGFFVFQPSLEMVSYYLSLLELPGRFKPNFPEQNLLNYAHRRDGNMPWTTLGNTWNIHYPLMADLKGGVKSLHEKWWSPENKDLQPWMESWRWRMEGFFEAMDRLPGGS